MLYSNEKLTQIHREVEMFKKVEPITIEEVERFWGNANFGESLNKRKMDVVKGALLKWASDYSTGYTAFRLLVDLGLITEKKNLTKKGKRQLWTFSGDKQISV